MSTDRPTDTIAPLNDAHGGASGGRHRKTGTIGLAVGSVGVVYGDIGTSPLYALRESLAHISKSGAIAEGDVISVVSLLIWALVAITTIKYVLFILRADNRGEGGTLSLMALARGATSKYGLLITFLGIVGASLFFSDAILTPAISVLSAVEGLKVVTAVFDPFVPIITIVILVTLFLVQKRGTEKVARAFGPIMCGWFVTLAVLGVMHIGDAPRILHALNPYWGLKFLLSHGFLAFILLGSVFLVITGSEAIYADLGHFGRKPIQYAWVCFVLPALLLNYLGQGAMILHDPTTASNPFFLMAPEPLRLALVLLATLATVIASQAVITGAYSVARQAIQLGLLPRLEIEHKSDQQEGQIFLPAINKMMLTGVVLLVIVFQSSSNLAAAYGIAIAASMLIDSCLVFVVVWKLWRWSLLSSVVFVGIFAVIEAAFLTSNITKFVHGGYVPVIFGLVLVIVMWSWMRGTKLLEQKTHRDSIAIRDLIRMLQKSQPTRVPGTAIFLTSDPQVAPAALMHNLKHNKVLHERVMIISVKTEGLPRVSPANRHEIEVLSDDFTAITLHFGFMESPRVPAALVELRKAGIKFDIMTTSFFLGRRTLKTTANSEMPDWQDKLYVSLSKQAANATDFFAIPSDRVVELGAQVTI